VPALHILEGDSLLPWLRGPAPADWRQAAIREADDSIRTVADRLGVAPRDARLFMVFDGRFRMMRAAGRFRPMLFDLAQDPAALTGLGAAAAQQGTLAWLYGALRVCWPRATRRNTRASSSGSGTKRTSFRLLARC